MRKFLQLCGVLILALLLYAIGPDSMPHNMPSPVRPTVAPPAPPPINNNNEDDPSHATIEYGTPEVIKHNSGPLYTYIRYPQAGTPTDEDIAEWAHTLYSNIVTEFNARRETDTSAIGEINVHFDSYLIDNRYAGILESGEFSYTLTTKPEVIVKTFNIDLTDNTFLNTTDILDYTQAQGILNLLYDRALLEHPGTDGFLDYIDTGWLNNLVIGHEGIIVVLERYKYFPDTFNTLTVTLPYEDLGTALLIRTEPPLDSPPTPPPAPPPGTGPDDPLPDDPFPDDPFPDDPSADDPPDDPPDDDLPEQTPSVPPQSGNIDPSKPMIALSFDDGPGIYTNDFLDLFEQYGIRATFCTIGNLVNTQSDALARAVSMGSEVIGHSWDHKNLAKLSAEDVRKQLQDTNNVIEAATGVVTPMFRPPYGAVSDTLRQVSSDLGLAIIYWSVDPEDWNTKNADAVYSAVLQHVKNGSIILSHEIYKSTLEAYKRLIPELLSQGYQIVTVSELLYYTHGELTPGHVYYDGYE